MRKEEIKTILGNLNKGQTPQPQKKVTSVVGKSVPLVEKTNSTRYKEAEELLISFLREHINRLPNNNCSDDYVEDLVEYLDDKMAEFEYKKDGRYTFE